MRLTPLMYPDIHQGPEGYLVKSLYFDDLYDSCASEKENGIHRREKYRIRQYGNSLDFIRLEKKDKMWKYVPKNVSPYNLTRL